jgi:hypothetical protein
MKRDVARDPQGIRLQRTRTLGRNRVPEPKANVADTFLSPAVISQNGERHGKAKIFVLLFKNCDRPLVFAPKKLYDSFILHPITSFNRLLSVIWL